MNQQNFPLKVFISYSHDGEDHEDWVLKLAERLRKNGVDALLDKWKLRLGSDLDEFMKQGLSKSKRVICICSKNYVVKSNIGEGGVGFEKNIMVASIAKRQRNSRWIIPLIRDNKDSDLPDFLKRKLAINFNNNVGYEEKYEELLRDLHNESIIIEPSLGPNPFIVIKENVIKKFLPGSEKYSSPGAHGTITFDYSNNNGRYSIGQGQLMFETAWSKASNTSIHAYSDSHSIKSIALVKDKQNINDIDSANSYDVSSRVRSPLLREIIIWKNVNGYYAATKIINIKDDTRGDSNDELTFEYVIKTDGLDNFVK